MPVSPGTIICTKCGEDRPTLIHEINDPLGKRFYCCVCGHEFRKMAKGTAITAAVFITVAMGTWGCASMTERIVNQGLKGLVWEADYAPVEGGNPEALAALYAHLTKLEIHIQYLPADDEWLRGAYGVSYHADGEMFIKLRQDLSVNGSIEVLAHEAAHLHQPPLLSRSQGDVFAEIVSAHVAAKLGVPDAEATSALWLRAHKPSLRMALDLQNEIEYVAKLLTPR